MLLVMENNPLGKFIAEVMDRFSLTSYDVEARSGGEIKQSWLIKVKNGLIKSPSAPKMKPLAKGLGVTEEELFAVVRGVSPDTNKIDNEEFQKMSLKFDRLPVEKKEKAREVIEMLDSYLDKLETEKGK